MCDIIGWPESVDWPEKQLDTLSSQGYIWAVRSRAREMQPDDVFRLRAKMSMTQRQFADLVGVDPITVSRWERGITQVSLAYSTHVRKLADEYKKARA